MAKQIEVGQRYGTWTVLELDTTREIDAHQHWFAECRCGEIRSRQASHIRRSAKALGLVHHGGVPCTAPVVEPEPIPAPEPIVTLGDLVEAMRLAEQAFARARSVLAELVAAS